MSSLPRRNTVQPESRVLAEAVGEGLHALAQPLTTALWNLELLVEAQSETPKGVAQALHSIELAVTKLDVVRDLIRPFRAATVFAPASLLQALRESWSAAHCVMESEGMQLVIESDASLAQVVVPEAFLNRMAALLLEVLRAAGPQSVRAEASESDAAVRHTFILSETRRNDTALSLVPEVVTLRGYVRVLGGTLSIADDGRQLCIELPR